MILLNHSVNDRSIMELKDISTKNVVRMNCFEGVLQIYDNLLSSIRIFQHNM